MAFNVASVALVKKYFLKAVLAVYIIAFTSLYVQVQSLFGDNGIVPLRDVKISTNNYNIILLAPRLGLNYGTFIELLCITSSLIALTSICFKRLCNAFTLGLLWYVYYSICSVGQGFMSFHSDLMLLEVGFISILLAPLMPTSKLSQSDHDHMSFFLVKWLVFRYFTSNVLNVYLDNDQTWYNMTAIPLVAQGVQFPSLFSWHIFNMPIEIVKLYQAYEHTVKLFAPFLFLLDLKYSRLLGFYTLLFVAIPSSLFFNFGWTDILICVCLLSFLKDTFFYNDRRAKQSALRTIIDIGLIGLYLGFVGFILVKYYGVGYKNNVLKSQVMFTPAQFKLFADHFVPVSLVVGVLGLLSAAYTAHFKSSRKTSIIKTIVYSIVVVALFFSTFPTMTRFAPGLEVKINSLAITKDLSRLTAPFMLSNNYLILSKVSQHYGDGRPELQVQGRSSAEDPIWLQFDLRYKPGLASKELPRVLPHLPRIDLKMWYAARSSIKNNQWLHTYVYRIATKENDVVNSLDPNTKIPKVNQIRIATLNYKYSVKGKLPFAGYWSQTKFATEYMPTTTVENLRFVVKSNGINLTPASNTADDSKKNGLEKMLNEKLRISSDYIRSVDHTAVIWSLTAIAAVSMLRR